MQASGTGQVEEVCRNLPFGDNLQCTTPVNQTIALGQAPDANAHRFTGKQRDTESGLDYFGGRYYGSTMGRFMSPDWAAKPEAVPYSSLENPQSLNLYTYVDSNPIGRVDLDGHDGHMRRRGLRHLCRHRAAGADAVVHAAFRSREATGPAAEQFFVNKFQPK